MTSPRADQSTGLVWTRTAITLALLLSAITTHRATAQAAPQDAPASPVVVDAVRSGEIAQATPITGTVHARRELQITAAAAGRLLYVQEPGARVEQGDTLVRIDAGPLVLQRNEQQAMLARQQVNLDFLQRQLARREQLAGANYVSDIEVEQARSERDLARADIAVARTRLAQLQDQIKRTTVSAPFSGIVSDQRHFAGEEVARGQVLARLVDNSALEVRAALPLTLFGSLDYGDSMEVIANAQPYTATVRALVNTGDVQSQTFEARLDLPADASRRIAVGQLAQVMLPRRRDQAEPQLLVPRDAVVLRRDGNYVYRIGEDNTAERVSISLGRGQGDWIAVDGALSAGDRVAIRGAERLQPGQAVEILRDLASEERVSAIG